MDQAFLEKLNKRLQVLDQNTVCNLRKTSYISLFAQATYSFFYDKVKINDAALETFLDAILNGLHINGRRFGGLYKIYFTELMDRLCDLVEHQVVPLLLQIKLQRVFIFLPQQRNGNFELNSYIFAFRSVRYLRENNIDVSFTRNLFELQNITDGNNYALLVMDDYSLTGKNLKDRLEKVTRIVPTSWTVFFIYVYCYTDTLYHIQTQHICVPSNTYVLTHSVLFNYPIHKYNILTDHNARFFCINHYYQAIFDVLDSSLSQGQKKRLLIYRVENTRDWYDFCKAVAERMDAVDLCVQKYLCALFENFHNFRLPPGEFYLPTTQVFTDYTTQSALDFNPFLGGYVPHMQKFAFVDVSETEKIKNPLQYDAKKQNELKKNLL